MLITKRVLQATDFASKDQARSALRGVHVLPDGSGVATNGHILVKVTPNGARADASDFPKTHGEHVTLSEPITLTRETCQAAEKAIDKKAAKEFPAINAVALTSNGEGTQLEATNLDSWQTIKANETDGQFPKWEQVIPTGDYQTGEGKSFEHMKERARSETDTEWQEYGVAPDYLADIARFAKKGGAKCVRLFISRDNKIAIGFSWEDSDGHEVDGLVMPMRV